MCKLKSNSRSAIAGSLAPSLHQTSHHHLLWIAIHCGSFLLQVLLWLGEQCINYVINLPSSTIHAHAGALYDRLAAEIKYQASTHDGPVFEPHVTLLGGIEEEEAHVVTMAADLAQELVVCALSTFMYNLSTHNRITWSILLQPYELRLQHVDTGSIYHQCVYVCCERTPAVMDAAWLARQRFGLPQSEYMPHLSLLYSDCDEATRYKGAFVCVAALQTAGVVVHQPFSPCLPSITTTTTAPGIK